MAYQPNDGHVPEACIVRDDQGEIASYRKVHVRTFGGWDSRKAGHDAWPAGGGREKTNWRISRPRHAFDIKEWEIA